MEIASEPLRELTAPPTIRRSAVLRLAKAAAPGIVLGVGSALACYFAAGDVLGLFFGGVCAATILAPALALAEASWRDRAIAWAALVLSIASVWLAPVFSGHVAFSAWLASTMVLAAYSAAIAGFGMILDRLGLASAAAVAIAVVLGLVWLSWPIWLCPWMTWGNRETVLRWLVGPHPLMAINGALRQTYAVYWAHHMLAYQLSNTLNDIPYELPRSVTACVLGHAATAAMAVGGSVWGGGRK